MPSDELEKLLASLRAMLSDASVPAGQDEIDYVSHFAEWAEHIEAELDSKADRHHTLATHWPNDLY